MSEDNRTYELGYIFVPTVPEQEVENALATVKASITTLEGTVVSEGAPEFIDLAYQIEKNVKSKKMKWNQGYFGWIKFTAAPEALEALKKVLDGNLELMRYMLIKTSAENNVVFKKPKVEAKRDDQSAADTDEEVSEEGTEDVAAPKEVHETLPDVEGDMTVETPSETVEG